MSGGFGAMSQRRPNQKHISAESAPEDAMFKECIEEFPDSSEALDVLIPRFKIVSDMRFEDNKNLERQSGFGSVVGNSGEWDYREEVKTWDLLQRLCRAQGTLRSTFEQQIGKSAESNNLSGKLSDADQKKYWGAQTGIRVVESREPLVQESQLLLARRVVETVESTGALPGDTLCWLKAVLDWLQTNVDPERLKKVFLWKEQMWAATKNANRDAPSWESGPRPDRFVPMDPDAPAHGLQLEDDDAEKAQHFMYALWMLYRCGHVGWAKQLEFAGRVELNSTTEHEYDWRNYKAKQSLANCDQLLEPAEDAHEHDKENYQKAVLKRRIELEQPLVAVLRGDAAQVWLHDQQGAQELNWDTQELPVAEVLCQIWGQPWRAATLAGGDFSHDPVLCGWAKETATGYSAQLPEQGCVQRQLWKMMCLALAQDLKEEHSGALEDDVSKVPQTEEGFVTGALQEYGGGKLKLFPASKYEQAIYGVLGGEAALADDVTREEWDDRLWVLVKVKFDELAEAAVQKLATPEIQDATIPATPRAQDQGVRETLIAIFKQLQPDQQAIPSDVNRNPLCYVQQLLILGDLDSLVTLLERMLDNAQAQPWRYRLLRFAVHIVLLVRVTPNPKEMNSIRDQDKVQGPNSAWATGELRFPTWSTIPEIPRSNDQARQAENNSTTCDKLLKQYAEYLALSGQEELAPTYIARLVEPDAQVEALFRLFTAMEKAPHLAQELSQLPDRSLHFKHIFLIHKAFQEHREGHAVTEDDPKPPDEYALRVIIEASCNIARSRPILPRHIKWVCTVAMEAAAAIPQYNTMYMSTPVHVALELLRELLGYFTSDEMWRPRVEEAIQLVGCLPLDVRKWKPSLQGMDGLLEDTRELEFWCEWVHGWDQLLRAEHAALNAGTVAMARSDVLQHTLAEGLSADAVESNALGAVRHLVKAMRILPSKERMQRHEQLLPHLVPHTLAKIHTLLVDVLCDRYAQQGQVEMALHVLEEALQMAPLIADKERLKAPLGDFISCSAMKQVLGNLAAAEEKFLKLCDQQWKGWSSYATQMRKEREDQQYEYLMAPIARAS